MLNEEEEIHKKTPPWDDSRLTASTWTPASRIHWRTLCHVTEKHKTQKLIRVGTRGTIVFFFLSFLLFFLFSLSLFNAAVLFWERRLSPRCAREGGEWMDGGMVYMCVSSCVPAWESQAGMKQWDRHTGTYTVCCKHWGTYIQYGSDYRVKINGVRYESGFSNISALNGTCMHHQFNMKCPEVCSGMHYIKRLLSLLINLSVTLINNWWIAWSIQYHIIVKNGLVSSKFQINLKWFKREKSSKQLHLRSRKRWVLDIFAW